MVTNEFIERFAKSVGVAEGFGVAGSIPTRANNPGDITDDGDLGYGVIRSVGPHGAPITIYPTVSDGWSALYRKIRRAASGASEVYLLTMTIAEIGEKWSGDPIWAKNFSADFGCSSADTLGALVTQDLQKQEQT
jgi:hypothetical protein